MIKNIFNNERECAFSLIKFIIAGAERAEKFFSVALSGGTTPNTMFEIWAEEFADLTPWDKLKIFWVDERCVEPNDSDSNYGNMKRLLLLPANVDETLIFRMQAECDNEDKRYAALLERELVLYNSIPQFDLVVLGVGGDGHTASIFPGQDDLLSTNLLCAMSVNPNGQKRVTLCATTICNAKKVFFVANGETKRWVLNEITLPTCDLPAAQILRSCEPRIEIWSDVSW